MNYFDPLQAAERYAKGRPHFHHIVIEKMRTSLRVETKIKRALDIACGTGLSTHPLLCIADEVYGTDTSAGMLEHALSKDRIHYSAAPAEKQNFQDAFFDLLTVSSGIHWFAVEDFLHEANRLLRTGGHLVIYDNFFISEMEGAPDFNTWFPEVYLARFPSPKRNSSTNWNQEELTSFEFKLIQEDEFKNDVQFTKAELILYFTTQSNITAAVQNGSSYEEVEAWLDTELSRWFKNEYTVQTIYFGNWMKYLKKS